MNVLIIGSGRMGIRHMQGLLSLDKVTHVTMLDIFDSALEQAVKSANGDKRISVSLLSNYIPCAHDLCIIASTADNRKELLDLAVVSGCKNILVEKPLGQSVDQIEDLISYVASLPVKVYVNLNMRLYDHFIKLKEDFEIIPQLKGPKTITLNTGTLGIGCNGIHYLDILNFLFDADRIEMVYSEIDDDIIPSGRGLKFCDFGGCAILKFYKQGKFQGKAVISMSSISTAFGGWEIIAPNGRILLDEITGKRTNTYRKIDSELPIYRYAGDYMPFEQEPFAAPFLGDLTAKWVQGIIEGFSLLPELSETLDTHKLMFEWLSKSNKYSKIFPIT